MLKSTIAIDWSGAADRADRTIWLAEVQDGSLTRLECGRSREEISAHLAEYGRTCEDLVVGLDFAFSFPSWYLEHRGVGSAPELWALAAREGESWLSECPPPFWGRGTNARPGAEPQYRRTEIEAPSIGGSRPKSVFQVNYPGNVGTGSVRGMPVLAALQQAGFAIWPFEARGTRTVVEIYPRLLTGAVVKKDRDERRAYLEENFRTIPGPMRAAMIDSEDAFDAGISATVMDRHRGELEALQPATVVPELLEGEIWMPRSMRMSARPRTAIESGYSKSGVRIAADFRDSLIVDRYDPVLAGMRGSKREALRSENSEDALTWNCFRSLRQIDPTIWLPVLASKAFGAAAPSFDASATVELWRGFDPPPRIRRFQKDEGASEVDIVIESDQLVWFIEAKFRSDISERTTNNPERDQVLRNIDVGSYYAGTRRFYFSLLTLDGRSSEKGRARLGEYAEDRGRLLTLLAHRDDGLTNLAGIGGITWADVGEALRVACDSATREDERVYAARAFEWLRERRIVSDA